jgi:crotonobetainyl-CoA:carnitine CoA-transferase CaiB-like acyl-CoA transferase
MILGDLGADVVKVEHPGRGDDTRAWGPPSWGDVSATFMCANRNKRGIAIDLDRADGVEIVRALAGRADVLVESFKPGALDRRGLGWDELHRDNERLIYCSISAFGQDGPRRDGPGYDPVVQAYSGIMHHRPSRQARPSRRRCARPQCFLMNVIGIPAASPKRATTGRVPGRQATQTTYWLAYHLGGYLASGVDPAAGDDGGVHRALRDVPHRRRRTVRRGRQRQPLPLVRARARTAGSAR